jgi:hypothetical protein
LVSVLGAKHLVTLFLLLFLLCKIILGTILLIAALVVMPVNRAPNIPTIGPDPSPDLVARLLAPLFLIPHAGLVINGDTGQNTALVFQFPVLVLVPAKWLTSGLGPMFYCRLPRPASYARHLRITPHQPTHLKTFISARPLRITPHLPTPLKAFISAHPLRITLLPATTWIRFVIIK